MFHANGPTFWELTRQALSSTERGYDLLAPKFDVTPFRTPDDVLRVAAARVGRAGAVLDLGCGTGAALNCFRPYADRLVGLDFSQGMLAEAARRLQPAGAELRLMRGNMLDLSFKQEFDTVLCFGALGHVRNRDQEPFLQGIHAALKPGGRFVFVTGRRPPLRSWQYWLARGFNGVMHVRNLLFPRRFVMYYLTFLWPEIEAALVHCGFEVTCDAGLFEAPFAGGLLVIARVPD